jgi:signal transduction histidine kinase
VATGLLMLGLLLAAWLLRGRSFGATAAILVTATLAGVILAVAWGGMPAAVCLLAVPAGLATVLMGAGWGAGLGALFTAGLYADALAGGGFFSLLGAAPADELRAVAAVAVWAPVGLLWVVLRPLLMAVEWAWSHFEQSQAALGQARDTQVQLKQALEDLSSANVQLTRLNQLAQGLRGAAEAARRAKEAFVANVSHELRTPLNMIIGYSRMIVQNPHVYGERAIPPALLADLAVILRNSQHLASLVDDVLDLSQIEAGEMALSKEQADLVEILDSAVTIVRPLFESKRLYLETKLEQALPAVHVDRTRIREVLLNLLSNAGRFTERGGVTVRVARTGAHVRFSVADTGPGIAAEDMSKLFRPFQQLDDSLSRRHAGTGLGLTLSKRFVELHGGRMWLESNAGQGSTFYFTLPLDETPVAAGGPMRWLKADWSMVARTRRSLAPAADVRPRFVVLDEAGTLCRLVTRYLDGFEITPAPDLAAAVKNLAETPAQALLVTDPGTLPWPSRPERLPAVASVPDGTPVILCTIPGAPLAGSRQQAAGGAEVLSPQSEVRSQEVKTSDPSISGLRTQD